MSMPRREQEWLYRDYSPAAKGEFMLTGPQAVMIVIVAIVIFLGIAIPLVTYIVGFWIK